jgi:hypothetical protein
MSTTTATSAAVLPAEVESLMRGLRLPHARAIAADVLATARAQRWDPTEVIKGAADRRDRRPGPLHAGRPPQLLLAGQGWVSTS